MVSRLLVVPSDKFLVSGSFDGSVRIWDLEDCQPYTVKFLHTQAVFGLEVSEDGRYLLWLEPHETRGWQIVGGPAGASPLKGPRHPDAPGLSQVKDLCR